MLRLLRLLLSLWVLVILQTTLAAKLSVFHVRPDLPFVLVLLVALHEGSAAGALAGFAAGLFVDLNSPQTLGVTSLATAIVAFAIGSVADRLERGSPPTRFVVAMLTVLLRDVLLVIGSAPAGAGRTFLTSVLPGAVYTALVALPLMVVLERAVGWGKELRRVRR